MFAAEDPWGTDTTVAVAQQPWQGNINADSTGEVSMGNGVNDIGDDGNVDFVNWSNTIRSSYNALASDIITVDEIPEKEGILFKHTNYLIQHLVALPGSDSSNDRKVIRRYSDFVWLLEVLFTKYPFRMIPELPPKKIASNGDPLFLERRRKGLARFMNQLMKHPKLSLEPLVLMFLTVPTDLSSWRKQAQYDTTEEYKDKKTTHDFQCLWEESYLEMWSDVELELLKSSEQWNKLAVLVERLEIRSRQIAQDNDRFEKILANFNGSISGVYQVDQSDIAIISEDLKVVGKHVASTRSLLEDESQESNILISEEFKKYVDVLLSMRALFDRYHRFGGNQVDQLTRRLESNKEKLKELNGKPDVKGMEIDRYNEAIERDVREIAEQTNRDWLIKETVLTEYIMFQETQFQITKVFQDWSRSKMKFSELQSNNWGLLINGLQDMPLSRHS